MQFSTNLNQSIPKQETPKQTWKQRFCSQAHQMFFISAIFFAIAIMFLTLFSLLGKVSIDFSIIHGFGLNYAVFTNAFLGFLITVIPKYNAAAAIKQEQYVKPWIALQAGFIITILINAAVGKILVALVMLYFAKIFYTTIKNGKATIKEDSLYLNSIFILGSLFLIAEVVFQTNLSFLIFFAYLINMVYFVALRMIPGFYYIYTKKTPWQKPKFVKPLAFALLILTGISMQFNLNTILILSSLIATIFFTYVFFKVDILKKTTPILDILVLGFAWVPVGFLALFIESFLELNILKASVHIFALGFVTTLLIGFGSRVSLGHAIPAQPITADKTTIWLFVFTQVLVLVRVLASVLALSDSASFMGFLHLSASLWIVLFIAWSLKYGKYLLRLQ